MADSKKEDKEDKERERVCFGKQALKKDILTKEDIELLEQLDAETTKTEKDKE